MEISTSIPFVNSSAPLDYEVLNQGRVLIIKDALYNPVTEKYHDIQLVRSGWKFLGWEWGGGTFNGLTKDAVRQIQETYGIVLKTLGQHPPGAAFFGDAGKTTYLTEDGESESYLTGQKNDDVMLSPSDAARFGESEMTLHEAIRAGIWNAAGWSHESFPSASDLADSEVTLPEEGEEVDEIAQYGSPIARQLKPREGAAESGKKRSWLSKPPENKKKEASESTRATTKTDRLQQRTALGGDEDAEATPETLDSGDAHLDVNEEGEIAPETMDNGASHLHVSEDGEIAPETLDGGASHLHVSEDGEIAPEPEDSGATHLHVSGDGGIAPLRTPKGKFRILDALKTSSAPRYFKQIESIPWISAYQAKSTPLDPIYDDLAVEERKSRIVEHLDRASKVPFSAFVDNNKERRIHPVLFHTMQDALRRLAKDPEADDSDAKEMKNLLNHWFRAAYHYLDKNSKPGDGYPDVLTVVSRGTKDPKKAEAKAKELYWRRQATDFWMTLIDLFSSEKIDIDLLHKAISTKTSLNPWF
jgi:hypothetical protein